MKAILALVVLAVLGFAVVGCGATKKIVVKGNPNSIALNYTGTQGIEPDHRIGPVSSGNRSLRSRGLWAEASPFDSTAARPASIRRPGST